MSVLMRVAQDKCGVTSVEYALIAALIAIASYGGVSIYANRLGIAWTHIAAAVPN